jgi:hypothetical protein
MTCLANHLLHHFVVRADASNAAEDCVIPRRDISPKCDEAHEISKIQRCVISGAQTLYLNRARDSLQESAPSHNVSLETFHAASVIKSSMPSSGYLLK